MWITFGVGCWLAFQRITTDLKYVKRKNSFDNSEILCNLAEYNANMGRYKSLVEIPQDKLQKWNIIRKEEDVREIAERAQVTRQLVYLALRTGQCQQYLLDTISAYYEERLEVLTAKLQDYAD